MAPLDEQRVKGKTIFSISRRKEKSMSSLHTNISTRRIAKAFYPLLVIGMILASEIAAICSINFIYRDISTSWQSWSTFLIAAPLAALLVGLPAWWLYVIQAENITIKRGIIVGCLSSIAAHPVMWTIVSVSDFLWHTFTHQLNPGLFSNMGILLPTILISLLYTGWITTIVGGIAGALLICLQRALTQEIEPQNEGTL
jgi:hypothetical protein